MANTVSAFVPFTDDVFTLKQVIELLNSQDYELLDSTKGEFILEIKLQPVLKGPDPDPLAQRGYAKWRLTRVE